jgi:hypothetical protein
LSLNRRKFEKNPTDLIRCKFSIDAAFTRGFHALAASTISKPYWPLWKPDVHHLHRMNPLAVCEDVANIACLTADLHALAFA